MRDRQDPREDRSPSGDLERSVLAPAPELADAPTTSLEDGLAETVQWFAAR